MSAGESTMRPLLALSAAIDLINEKIGYVCNFLVLAACVVSAVNAMVRYAFGYSSNGWLELPWYMFAIMVMFGASYTFKRNEHVRVEILSLFLTERGLPVAGLPVVAVFLPGLRRRRDVGECRRTGALAYQIRGSGRLRDAGVA